MSLENKFDNLNPFESIDRFFIEINEKLADKWQNTTGKSKNELITISYLIGSSSFAINAIIKNDTMSFLPIFLSANLAVKAIHKGGGFFLDIENKTRYGKVTSKFEKTTTGIFYTSEIPLIAAGALSLVTSYDQTPGIESLSYGIGNFLGGTGEYLGRSNPGDPPKKRKVIDKVKDYMTRLFPKAATQKYQ